MYFTAQVDVTLPIPKSILLSAPETVLGFIAGFLYDVLFAKGRLEVTVKKSIESVKDKAITFFGQKKPPVMEQFKSAIDNKVKWEDDKYTPWACNLPDKTTNPKNPFFLEKDALVMLPNDESCKIKPDKANWLICPSRKEEEQIPCVYFCPSTRETVTKKAELTECAATNENYPQEDSDMNIPRTRSGVAKVNGLQHINDLFLELKGKKDEINKILATPDPKDRETKYVDLISTSVMTVCRHFFFLLLLLLCRILVYNVLLRVTGI